MDRSSPEMMDAPGNPSVEGAVGAALYGQSESEVPGASW